MSVTTQCVILLFTNMTNRNRKKILYLITLIASLTHSFSLRKYLPICIGRPVLLRHLKLDRPMKRTARKTNAQATTVKKQNVKEARTEEPYSVQLNGNNLENDFSAPPWPISEMPDEKLFILPKKLDLKDKITVKCKVAKDPKQLKIGLVTGDDKPDLNNMACEVEMSKKVKVKSTKNGKVVNDKDVSEESLDSNVETGVCTMAFRVNKGCMDLHLHDIKSESVKLIHDVQKIKFLCIKGDFEKVVAIDFQFETDELVK